MRGGACLPEAADEAKTREIKSEATLQCVREQKVRKSLPPCSLYGCPQAGFSEAPHERC